MPTSSTRCSRRCPTASPTARGAPTATCRSTCVTTDHVAERGRRRSGPTRSSGYEGYASDVGRTWVVGAPSADAARSARALAGDHRRGARRAASRASPATCSPGSPPRLNGGTKPWLDHFFLGHTLGLEGGETAAHRLRQGPGVRRAVRAGAGHGDRRRAGHLGSTATPAGAARSSCSSPTTATSASATTRTSRSSDRRGTHGPRGRRRRRLRPRCGSAGAQRVLDDDGGSTASTCCCSAARATPATSSGTGRSGGRWSRRGRRWSRSCARRAAGPPARTRRGTTASRPTSPTRT